MNERVRTGIIYGIILLAVLVLSIWFNWTPILMALAVAFLGSLEIGSALSRKFRPLSLGWVLVGSLIFLAPLIIAMQYSDLRDWYLISEATDMGDLWKTDFLWLMGLGIMSVILAYVLFAFIKVAVQIIQRGPAILPHSVAELAASFYLGIPLSVIVLFTFAVPDGFKWLILAIIMPAITDVAAYYSGNRFGHRQILPKVSPKKTVAGFIGGLIVPTFLVGVLFIVFLQGSVPLDKGTGETFIWGAIAGLLLSLSSQVGDWVASALKRYCGIKDFSHLLPGHGGILDRFDSVLYCLPVTLFVALGFYLI